MFLRVHRLAVAALMVTGGLLGGCEGCGSGPGPGTRPASITVRLPQGNTVPADGVSRVRIGLKAVSAAGEPDTSTMTIEAPSGALAPAGGELVAGNTLTAAPNDEGAFEFEYQCPANTPGNVALAVTNGAADATVNISCVEPAGEILISITDDSEDCRRLQADGENDCEIFVSVSQRADGTSLARTGAAIITVVETAPVDASTRVLSNATGGPTRTEQISVTVTDNGAGEGVGSFFIGGTTDPATITYTVNFEGTVVTRDFIIDSFDNESAIDIEGGNNTIGGTPATININVTRADGLPARNESIKISVAGGVDGSTVAVDGVDPDEAIEATLDGDGKVTATVNTPVVTEATLFVVTVEYQFLQSATPLTGVFNIEAREQNAVILNLASDRPIVRSDVANERTTQIEVTFTKNDTKVVGGEVTLTIRSTDQARINFVQDPANTTAEIVLDEADFDANGRAFVEVTALPNAAPGTGTITAVGADSDQSTADETEEVVITVERAPILQSIVAEPIDPAVIGVRGSVLRSTTLVRFRLFDDRNDPMPNVPVEFTTNATADREVTVTKNDVSDNDGFVQTILAGGTIAGPVSVIVTATPVSPDPSLPVESLTVQSPSVAIVGGLPNFLASFMSCSPAISNREGTGYACQVTLVDRFSNVVPEQTVQFKAEGSGSSAVGQSDADGIAAATLALDDGDLVSGASVPNWSYGFIPLPGSAVATAFPGCFDSTLTTGCDLIQLCANHPDDCPLKPGCVADAQAAESALDIQGGFASLSVRDANIQDYVNAHRSCGYPVSCLTGVQTAVDGVLDLPGDECTLSLGCMDYSTATECPHDGLITVVAATRGEESFSDGNGNGVFDFFDLNGNGRQDPTEAQKTRPERCLLPVGGGAGVCELDISAACSVDADCVGAVALDNFVDLPEPFADKNDSCSFDDFTNVPRFRFTPSERAKHTDLFSDVDGLGTFGFAESTGLFETNRLFDLDTETFQTAHVLAVGAERFIAGTACTLGTPGCVENVTPAGVIGINPAGIPSTLPLGGSVVILYRWFDGVGNCPSPGFASISEASATGALDLAGDDKVVLNDAACGFVSGTNPIKPFCEDLPALGAPVGRILVREDCGNLADDSLSGVEWLLNEQKRSITIDVLCGG